MNLQMVGVDFRTASVAQRESLSFVKGQINNLLSTIAQKSGVLGCAILSTCNRTELYLHTVSEIDALRVLTDAAGASHKDYRAFSMTRSGAEMVRHVMEVASGLQSQIYGDDQIVTQMRIALEMAREAGTADSVLDTLLRRAVTAGKRVKTETRLSNVGESAASHAVKKAERFFGTLVGLRAVVIGNGEMGRITASLLRGAGCDVTITLRSYRHGETIVPAGCHTYPYESRYEILDGADLVFSATSSPHLTITGQDLAAAKKKPRLLVDLAMPRDIGYLAENGVHATVWNLDDLGVLEDENAEERAHANEIIVQACKEFAIWHAYREALPIIAQLKDLAAERVHFDHSYDELRQDEDIEGLIQLSVAKTIDMLLGGMKEVVNTPRLEACVRHIKKGSGK